MKAGVSLNPHTSLSNLENVLSDVDMVLIMSVNPGFGGQSFIPQALTKVKQLKQMLKDSGNEHVEIEIDGGIKLDNIKEVAQAGVDVFVSGSGIFKSDDPKAMIGKMIQAIE